MKTKSFLQIGTASLSLLLLGTSAVLAADQAVCSAPSSTGVVFSTLKDGGITFRQDARCAIQFFGNTKVNTESFNYPDKCDAFLSKAEADAATSGGSGKTKLTASGTSIVGPTLPAFEESPENFRLRFDVNKVTYTVGGTWVTTEAPDPVVWPATTSTTNHLGSYTLVGGTETRINFVGGVATVTIGSRTFTIKLIGSEGGAHSYVLSGGDYGEISWDNMGGSQLTGVSFEGPIRAKSISGGNCNDSTGLKFAGDKTGLSPEYLNQNYINVFMIGDGCAVTPGSTGRTTLNLLGKTGVGSAVVWGFRNSQSNSCWNYDPEQCKASPKDWSNMYAQDPARLQINLYNGTFKTTDRISIAAGIYIPNGNFNITGAGAATIVGEVLAKNVVSEQNNDGSKFFGKTTSTSSLQNKYYSLTPPISDRSIKTGDYIYRATQRDYQADGKTKGSSGHLMAFAMKADSSHDEAPVWDAADPAIMTNRAAVIKTEVSAWATAASDFEVLGAAYGCIVDPRSSGCRETDDPRDPASLVGVPWRTAPIIVGNSVLFATDDGILYSVNKSTGTLNWGWIPRQILARTTETGARVQMALKHSWGQIGSMTVVAADGLSKQVYVTGSALGGQLHFSIEVAEDGTSLKNVAWIDYQAGAYSPGSLTTNFDGSADNRWPGREGRPYGGAAPVGSFVDGSLKVAYIAGDKLFIRNVDGSDSAPVGKAFVESGTVSGATVAPAITPSSNLLYMDDSRIYFGADNGKMYQSDTSGSLDNSDNGISKLALGTEPVWYTNGSRLVSGSGSALMLTAQSQRRVNVLKYAADAWSLAWWTGLSATGETESSSATAEQIPVTAADDAQITAPASIRNGQIILYYTKGVSGCAPEAYSFGPLHLEDGSSALSGAQFRFVAATSLSNYIGVGQATGGSDVVVNGKEGVLAGSSGTTMESGNTGILTNSGANNRKRLNWRELTNFF